MSELDKLLKTIRILLVIGAILAAIVIILTAVSALLTESNSLTQILTHPKPRYMC
jgi:hypothetical protein